MQRHIPPYFEELYTRSEVEARIRELARDIAGWCGAGESRRESQVLAVCILRGSVFFFSDLLKEIPSSLQPAFCLCRSYSSEENGVQSQKLEIQFEPQGISGRRILLVDDICDTGKTLEELEILCKERGALEVKSAVLIHRIRKDSHHTPTFAAFRYDGEEWFSGYGMEDRNFAMNYPAVYRLRRTED